MVSGTVALLTFLEDINCMQSFYASARDSKCHYKVFNCDCNKLVCSFTMELFEELLDILFSTIVNFELKILLLFELFS